MGNAEIPGLMSRANPHSVLPRLKYNHTRFDLQLGHTETVWSLQNWCPLTDFMAIQREQLSGTSRDLFR